MSDIRFTYLQDPEEPARKLVIARTLTRSTKTESKLVVQFSTAVNRVSRNWSSLESKWREHGGSCWGDKFSKKLGRQIAVGRLQKNPMELVLPEDKRPVKAILKHLSTSSNVTSVVKRIANHYVDKF